MIAINQGTKLYCFHHNWHGPRLFFNTRMPRLYQLIIFIVFLPSVCTGQIVFEQQHAIPVTDAGKSLQNPWVGGLNSGQYNRADLDGDGMEELIIYDRSSDTFQIFRMENSKLSPADGLNVLLPDLPAGWVLFVDYDGDGKKDIFSNGGAGAIVYKNTGASGQSVQWKKMADPLLTNGFSGKINLIVNASDVPAITDIDSDGDVDILVYNFAIGGYIRYNKNLSMELFGNADSLEYEIHTRTWGEFAECSCNDFAFGGATCNNNGGRVTHAGGKALLAIDTDGDGDKDLLAGHEQCEELYFFENMGGADSAYMLDYSNLFPSASQPANFHLFPTAYFEDVDFDGIKDLLVTPGFAENYGFKIDFAHSNWMYKNIGSDANPDFSFQERDFLQKDMLDFGENAVPAFFDYDADGKTDILVAANGFWNGDNFSGHVIAMKNTGTHETPSFEIVDKNYLDLASLDLVDPTLSLIDFDGDSAVDLVYTGTRPQNFTPQSWLLTNQSPADQAAHFDVSDKQEIILPNTVSSGDNPTFFDVDADGQVDLLVGKKSGALEYYKNKSNLQFELANAEFLGIGRDFSLEKTNLAATVADLDGNGLADLITTDHRGIGLVYFDFQLHMNDTPDPVALVYKSGITMKEEPLSFDTKSWVSGADVFGQGTQSIVVGGIRGGLQLYKNTSTNGGQNGQKSMDIHIYPNPVENTSEVNLYANQNLTIELLSMLGQQMRAPFPVEKFTNSILNVGNLPNGSYILKSTNASGIVSSQLLMIQK